jgi:hypothetical protein
MQKVIGKNFRKLLMEFQQYVICTGLLSFGSRILCSQITDEVILEYIRTQDVEKDDEVFIYISP